MNQADPRATAVTVADVWASPTSSDERDRVTQLLLGEPVTVRDRAGDRVLVTAPWQPSSLAEEGYPGWVRAADLDEPVAPGALTARVVVPRVVSQDGRRLLSFGTVLPVDDADRARVRLRLPGGGSTVVDAAAVRLAADGEPPAYDVDGLLDSGRLFLGLPYRWGGLSQAGLDCSGLVHLTWRVQGIRVPRDAFDQAADLPPVRLGQERAGDLYFFARPGRPAHHVGLVTGRPGPGGERRMLHASETDRFLVEGTLSPERTGTLVGVARVSSG